MIDEIEELWKLAEECRKRARERANEPDRSASLVAEMRELLRTADRLDEIARRLGARLPT
jgi:hypothetical protein